MRRLKEGRGLGDAEEEGAPGCARGGTRGLGVQCGAAPLPSCVTLGTVEKREGSTGCSEFTPGSRQGVVPPGEMGLLGGVPPGGGVPGDVLSLRGL